jgi:hypothetical protein
VPKNYSHRLHDGIGDHFLVTLSEGLTGRYVGTKGGDYGMQSPGKWVARTAMVAGLLGGAASIVAMNAGAAMTSTNAGGESLQGIYPLGVVLEPGEHVVTIDLLPNTQSDGGDVFRVVVVDQDAV